MVDQALEAIDDSPILPILGSVGSASIKTSIRSLQAAVLKELHVIAPLRSWTVKEIKSL
jgi:hypothetical protein